MTAPNTVLPENDTLESIQKVYEQLGLATAHDRLRYADPATPAPANPQFQVTISNTSTPTFG